MTALSNPGRKSGILRLLLSAYVAKAAFFFFIFFFNPELEISPYYKVSVNQQCSL